MAKKNNNPRPSFLDNFSLDNLSSDDIGKGQIKPTKVKPISTEIESAAIITKEDESLVKKETQPHTPKKTKPKNRKHLTEYFEKNYTTSNSTRTTVDANVIAIIDKVTNATPKLYSVNLVSNILANWIEEHREEIEEHLKEMSKI